MARTKEVITAVPKETLQQWKVKFVQGDKGIIAKEVKKPRQYVYNAFNGFAKPSLIAAINKFYGIKN